MTEVSGPPIRDEPGPHRVSQTAQVAAVAEDKSLINSREIEDWCSECRRFRSPIISATNALGASAGLFVGFLTALAPLDRTSDAMWWGIFLAGAIIFGLGMAAALAYLIFDTARIRDRVGLSAPVRALDPLAERMERAKEHGRPQGAVVQALDREASSPQ